MTTDDIPTTPGDGAGAAPTSAADGTIYGRLDEERRAILDSLMLMLFRHCPPPRWLLQADTPPSEEQVRDGERASGEGRKRREEADGACQAGGG